MGIFRPVIQRLPLKAQTGMTLVIVAVMLVLFVIMFIHQRTSNPSLIQLVESPTSHQLQLDELVPLKRVNPSFYGQAQAGDWVMRDRFEVKLYRPSTNQTIVSVPATQ